MRPRSTRPAAAGEGEGRKEGIKLPLWGRKVQGARGPKPKEPLHRTMARALVANSGSFVEQLPPEIFQLNGL